MDIQILLLLGIIVTLLGVGVLWWTERLPKSSAKHADSPRKESTLYRLSFYGPRPLTAHERQMLQERGMKKEAINAALIQYSVNLERQMIVALVSVQGTLCVGVSKCHADDTFSYERGMDIALSRVLESTPVQRNNIEWSMQDEVDTDTRNERDTEQSQGTHRGYDIARAQTLRREGDDFVITHRE